MNGDITVVSDLGKGSIFTVELQLETGGDEVIRTIERMKEKKNDTIQTEMIINVERSIFYI